jgi:endoglucanase
LGSESSEANGSTVNQPNVAYVFHFYAGSHSVGSYGGRVTQALNAGKCCLYFRVGYYKMPMVQDLFLLENLKTGLRLWNQIKLATVTGQLGMLNDDGSNEASALFTGSTILNNKTALQQLAFLLQDLLLKTI